MTAVIPGPGGVAVVAIRPMTEEDIPAALRLWQGLAGIGLRDALVNPFPYFHMSIFEELGPRMVSKCGNDHTVTILSNTQELML